MIRPDHQLTLADFFALLNGLNCGAALVDRGGNLVFVNDRLCQMTKSNYKALAGASVSSLYEAQESAEILEDLQEHFREMRQRETYLPLPGGEKLPVIASSSLLQVDSIPEQYRLVTMLDISAQKQAETDLREQYRIIAELSNTILEQAMGLRDHSATLEERVKKRTWQLHEANLDAIYMLALASEAKDQDTGRHVRRIRNLTEMLAREMAIDASQATAMGHASILHDVGKMHVPDHILQKPGKLTAEERAVMQEHTITAGKIIIDKPFFAVARRIARSHHENWDGSGYPDRLSGSEIPREARIVHLGDVYDALTNARCYKPAWAKEQAVETIAQGEGTMFDPEVVEAFRGIIDRIEVECDEDSAV